MDFNYNDLLLEADDEAKEEEKKDEKKEDEKKDEDKKEESKDNDTKSSNEDDSEYNDLMDDDVDSDIDDDISDDTDEEYNDLIDDEPSDDISDDTDSTAEDSGDDYNTLIVVKTGEGETGEGSVYDKLAKLGYLYTIIANNMKHIHLNSAGRKFEEIHRQSEEYYNHFNYKCDQYFELAAESPITKLDNPTRSKEHVEDIEVESSENYTFETAIAAMSSNFNKAIDYLKSTRAAVSEDRTDIQSTLDEELTYLNKQYNFILRKKMISDDTVTPDAPTEAAMESYNWLI